MKTLLEIFVALILSLFVAWILSIGIIDDNMEIKAGKAPLSGFYPN